MKELQVQNENALPASSKEGKMTKSSRRTPLSNKTNKLAQNDASSTLLLKPRKHHGLRVFEETAAEERAAPAARPVTRCTVSTQTDPDEPPRGQESAVDRLVADMCAAAEEPSGEYWRQLAESRQQALEEALQENQQLHEQLDTAREEIRLMREALEQAEGVVAAVQEWSDEQEQAQ
ncbi:geminin-like [Amphibalanus amphitrite]|uniref:geminin-like n=1 Tax=Amphibalanus amphitrite TaxID=1232801 RepID=UPI001C905BE3|nr:geminin-like [Amphibalanus amphitrite]XP_043192042.1 geminin-like [Amphibalanus amphitrite]